MDQVEPGKEVSMLVVRSLTWLTFFFGNSQSRVQIQKGKRVLVPILVSTPKVDFNSSEKLSIVSGVIHLEEPDERRSDPCG